MDKKNILKRLILISGILLFVFVVTFPYSATAMPPHPFLHDGTEKAAQEYIFSEYNNDPNLNKPSMATSLKSAINGQFRLLAILVEFTDTEGAVNPLFFDTLLFGNHQGTVTDYYSVVSYGGLDIVSVNLPSAIGWIQAPQTYDYYVNANRGVGYYPRNTQKLCEDIVDLIDPLIDFSLYDNDGDDTVDAVIMVHTGSGYEITGDVNDIHSHKWSITPRLKDNVFIYDYTIQPEFWYAPGDMTCGVYCHELGHIFGLPDLYDTDYSSRGVGVWSVMGYGSWLGPGYDGSYPAELDAWSRIELGFATPTTVTSNIFGATINGVSNGGNIVRLYPNGSPGSEYYLIENRQTTGYDSYLPGDGLLIWHIDESILNGFEPNTNEWYPTHTSSGHYGIALEQADGLFNLERYQNSGDGGDPFPGNMASTTFSSVTTPGSNLYSGTPSLIIIDNISSSAPAMTADLMVTGLSSVNDTDRAILPIKPILSQNYPNPFNPSTRIDIQLPRGGNIALSVYDILGQKVAEILNGFYPAGEIHASWDGTDADGRDLSSGVYFYELLTENSRDSKKMIMLK